MKKQGSVTREKEHNKKIQIRNVISRHPKLVADDDISLHAKNERDLHFPLLSANTAPASKLNSHQKRIMPCQENCEMEQLNLQLKYIKVDKVETLRDIYRVTDQIGRENPHRREEMEVSKAEIYEKLTTAVAQLLCIEEEIIRGCRACREN